MDLEYIDKIINEYEKIIDELVERANILFEIDKKYWKDNHRKYRYGISKLHHVYPTEIEFEWVDYDTPEYISFDKDYFTCSAEEAVKMYENAMHKKVALELEKTMQREEQEKKEQDEIDFQMYKALKKKFGDK